MKNKIEMHIAVHEPTGNLIGIDKAIKGKNCDCHCWSCGGELIARQGEKNQWHFAHYHNSEKECDYSFWVVCRDLAKQIFKSLKEPNNTIRLCNDIGNIQISDISFDDTKIKDITFDLSFATQEYGQVFVFFITQEQKRDGFDTTIPLPENILLINLKSVENKKEKVTEELQEIILKGFNIKKFIEKNRIELKTTPQIHYAAPRISLFDEVEEEERAHKKSLEIINNTPDISNYKAHEFIQLLRNPKLEINTSKFTPKDHECVESLDKIFLHFIKKYGYNYNKHFMFKEIANDNKFYLASYYERFLGFVILEYKFVLFVPKNKTLVPILSVNHKDSIGRLVKSSMIN